VSTNNKIYYYCNVENIYVHNDKNKDISTANKR